MFYSDIPQEHNPMIKEWSDEGDTPEQIAALLEDQGIVATAATVARRLREIVATNADPPRDLEEQVWASLSMNLRDLDEAEARLRELETHRFDAATRRIGNHGEYAAEELDQTHIMIARRATLVLSKQKLLQAALMNRAKRRHLEASIELAIEARRALSAPPVTAVPAPLAARAEETLQLPPASTRRSLPDASAPCVEPAVVRSDADPLG